ncbi:hypothetical protein [Sciscionella marina]|uniref:hypothetical protein n=1 Tax=Sciscionella marina TaxID=508770 RepID=UPI00037C0B3C|nr:hypothetical protein [Sciscionella marina]
MNDRRGSARSPRDEEPTPWCAAASAYALHALIDTELAAFEQHLTECAACRQEVDRLRETAARLGAASATQPPAHLREKVLSEIAHTRQQPPD